MVHARCSSSSMVSRDLYESPIIRSRGILHTHPKAEPDNPNHVAASMPGKVTKVNIGKGDKVRQGQGVLSLEAMKMEAAVYAPRDATIADVLVETGSVVAAGDLLVVLEG